MRAQQLFFALLSFSALSRAAWHMEDAFGGVEMLKDFDDVLFRRQDTASDSSSAQASSAQASSSTQTGSTRGTITSKPTNTRTSASSSNTNSDSNSNSTDASAAASTEYDNRDPPGGISMVTPAATAGATYYKVGDYITFAWNYTSLSATPSAIDVFASCKANSALYTLAVNMTAETTGKVIWDTKEANAKQNMLSETYTLIVMDAQSSISATARAGYLSVAKDFTFPLYVPQPYTPWADYQCATCNAAMGSAERQALAFLAGTASITVLSFTWFAYGFGIF